MDPMLQRMIEAAPNTIVLIVACYWMAKRLDQILMILLTIIESKIDDERRREDGDQE
jgi:hypothetical protein